MSDDLSKISGVGPATVEKLNGQGITTFDQVANLTDDQILQLNEDLDLRDSIINHDWRSQAKSLMSRDTQASPPSGASTDETREKPKGRTVPVQIKRDMWDGDGVRHRKGSVIELPVEDAMDAVEAGTVTRVK